MYRGGAKLGHYTSEATKAKISKSQKGRVNVGRHNSPGTEIKRGQHLSPRTEFKEGSQGHKGYHHSLKTKRNLSLFYQKQRVNTVCDYCGKPISLIPWRVRMHKNHFCSVSCQRHFYAGERNNHWKGGVTPENQKARHSIEFKIWRAKVFQRDNFQCVRCGATGSLHPHHIKSFAEYPELRFDLSNGITLCKNCHILAHANKFG